MRQQAVQLGGGEGSTSLRTGLNCCSGPGREQVFSALCPRGHTSMPTACPSWLPRTDRPLGAGGQPRLWPYAQAFPQPCHHPEPSGSDRVASALSTWETTDFRCLGPQGACGSCAQTGLKQVRRPHPRARGTTERGTGGQWTQLPSHMLLRGCRPGPGLGEGLGLCPLPVSVLLCVDLTPVPRESGEQVHVRSQARPWGKPSPVVSLPRDPEALHSCSPASGSPPHPPPGGPSTCHLAPVLPPPRLRGQEELTPSALLVESAAPTLLSPLPLPPALTQEPHGAGLPRLPPGRPQ